MSHFGTSFRQLYFHELKNVLFLNNIKIRQFAVAPSDSFAKTCIEMYTHISYGEGGRSEVVVRWWRGGCEDVVEWLRDDSGDIDEIGSRRLRLYCFNNIIY